MKKIILTETQFKQYINFLKEDYASMYSSSTTSTPRANALPTSNGKSSGSVTMKKRDANPDNIKKYTDKGININIIDENSEFLKKYFDGDSTLKEEKEKKKNFSINDLEDLKTFKEREDYCKEHLKELREGPARVVYNLNDGEYVLKLAKNEEGLKKNAVEADMDSSNPILPKCKYYDFSSNYVLFVIMEKAETINESDFKKLTDIDFNQFEKLVKSENSSIQSFISSLENLVNDSEKAGNFYKNLKDYIDESKIQNLSDLSVLQNFGKMDRDGKEDIVLLDYGK